MAGGSSAPLCMTDKSDNQVKHLFLKRPKQPSCSLSIYNILKYIRSDVKYFSQLSYLFNSLILTGSLVLLTLLYLEASKRQQMATY